MYVPVKTKSPSTENNRKTILSKSLSPLAHSKHPFSSSLSCRLSSFVTIVWFGFTFLANDVDRLLQFDEFFIGHDEKKNLFIFRYYITAQRVQKTLQHLPGTSYEQLPLLFCRNTHPLKDLRGQNKMYIRLHHQPNAIVIIEYEERPGSPCEMDYRYYLLWVKPATIEDDPKDETITSSIPKVLLKALGMVEFDSFLVTHSSTTKVDVQDLSEKIIGKRKYAGKIEAPIKRRKGHPAYFLPDLARIVAFADERIPFMALSAELSRQNVIIGGRRNHDISLKIIHDYAYYFSRAFIINTF